MKIELVTEKSGGNVNINQLAEWIWINTLMAFFVG